MSTGEDTSTVILPVRLTADYVGTLEIQFGPEVVQRYHLGGEIRLTIGPQRAQCFYRFFGHNIFTFCEQLTRLRETLQGSARLFNWDWEELLCFSPADRRGTIVVGGCINATDIIDHRHSESAFLSSSGKLLEGGTRLMFDGLLLDQSDLARPVAAMRRFLSDNDVVTANPDSSQFDWEQVRS